MYKRRCSWMYHIKEIGKKTRILEWYKMKDRDTGDMCILFHTTYDWYMYREHIEDVDVVECKGVTSLTKTCIPRHSFYQRRSGYMITINNPFVTDSCYWTYTDLIDRIELV